MRKLIKQEGNPVYLVNEWIATSTEDLENIDLSQTAPGSTCIVAIKDDQGNYSLSEYLLTLQGDWIPKPAGGGSGSGQVSEDDVIAIINKHLGNQDNGGN